jgi:hypothetical protein
MLLTRIKCFFHEQPSVFNDGYAQSGGAGVYSGYDHDMYAKSMGRFSHCAFALVAG